MTEIRLRPSPRYSQNPIHGTSCTISSSTPSPAGSSTRSRVAARATSIDRRHASRSTRSAGTSADCRQRSWRSASEPSPGSSSSSSLVRGREHRLVGVGRPHAVAALGLVGERPALAGEHAGVDPQAGDLVAQPAVLELVEQRLAPRRRSAAGSTGGAAVDLRRQLGRPEVGVDHALDVAVDLQAEPEVALGERSGHPPSLRPSCARGEEVLRLRLHRPPGARVVRSYVRSRGGAGRASGAPHGHVRPRRRYSRASIAAACLSRSTYWSSPTLTSTWTIVPPLNRAGDVYSLRHGVGGVAADAEPVAAERELGQLGAHRPARRPPASSTYSVVVPCASPCSPVALLDELHAEHVLARLERLGDELLLRRDAEEVVDVPELPVLEEQRVAAEAGAVGEDHALGVRARDLDLGQDLERAAAGVGRHRLRHVGGVRVVDERARGPARAAVAGRPGSRRGAGRRAAGRCNFSASSNQASISCLQLLRAPARPGRAPRSGRRRCGRAATRPRRSGRCPDVGPCTATAFQPFSQMPRVPSIA